MKTILFLILAANATALASGPSGDLSQWKGRYETTKCIQCPDRDIDSGANLKNFTSFAFGYGQIDPKEKLDCAQTDIWIGMDFTIQSDDKNITDSVGHTAGQCSWNEKFGQSLVATKDKLSYVSHGQGSDKMTLTVEKTGSNTYLFNQVNHRDTPSWGYPNDWEYKVEMKKVDSNP
ncbi:MAG: hypothetical protein ACXWRU_18585 [Pseudobdellovibrionaceae bacterium]